MAAVSPRCRADTRCRRGSTSIRHAEAQRSWEKVAWLHEKPYRLPVFLSLCERLSDRDYWQALGSLWLETENLYEYEDAWLEALTAGRPGRTQWLMDTSNRDRLTGLSETPTVYRGFAPPGSYRAPSSSLSRSRAEWFAGRAGRSGAATGMIPRSSAGRLPVLSARQRRYP
jgi:hypothetical protein